ncbi:MAG: hypothetical protein MUD16_16600 [Desulfobacterales bacterium]|jgi:hypothetical protein|nr:hypothetical protein [Desulfobacterales bacterium]
MRTGNLSSRMSSQSVILFLLCGAGILAFVLLVNLPSQRLSEQIERDIAGLVARIEEQRMLAPIFSTLFAKAKTPSGSTLPQPGKTKLTREEISEVPRQLMGLAAVNKLTVREITPDVNTLADASNRFSVRVAATGRFLDLRGFLLSLGGLPFLEAIEEIEVRAAEGGTEEMTIKLWLARE